MRIRTLAFVALSSFGCILACAGPTAIPLPLGAGGLALDWFPGGDALAVVYGKEDSSVWLRAVEVPEGDVRWEKRIGEIPSGDPRPPVFTACVSPDGDRIAVGSPWGIPVFSSSGELIWAYPVGLEELPFLLRFLHADELSPGDFLALVVARAVHWGPPMLASPFADVTLEIRALDAGWELNDDAPLGAWPLPVFSPRAAYSCDGELFAAATMNPETGEWLLGFLGGEAEGGAHYLTELLGKAAEPTALAVSPHGREVALGLGTQGPGEAPLIRRLDPVSGEELAAYFPCDEYQCFISGLDWSPDGRYLAYSARAEGYLRLGIIELETEREAVLCQGENLSACPALYPRFSPAGGTLATLGGGGISLWHIEQGDFPDDR